MPHAAGNSGFGGASYIDLVVCRDKDANTAWTSASDTVLEERVYYCQNWRADVSAIVSAAGGMLEWAKYSAYGLPFGLPGGDVNSDGDCDSVDATQIQSLINAPAYELLGDVDLDGDVDATDKSLAMTAPYAGAIGGRPVLSTLTGIRTGFGGAAATAGSHYLQRYRVLHVTLGRWVSRDPLRYNDGTCLFEYVRGAPVTFIDPTGRAAQVPGGAVQGNWGGGVVPPTAPGSPRPVDICNNPVVNLLHGEPLSPAECTMVKRLSAGEQLCMIQAIDFAAAVAYNPVAIFMGRAEHDSHCVASCLLAGCVSVGFAGHFMWLHEQHTDYGPADEWRDLIANDHGLECAEQDDGSGASREDQCLDCCMGYSIPVYPGQ